MFIRLGSIVKDYNNSGQGKAALQEYDACNGKAFILCIVTSLMCRVHEKISQAGELCYMDASASFEQLNTSITLLYTSCTVGALPLGMFITSDELETTLKKAIGLLKTILPEYAFFRRSPLVGLVIFLTDDSSAERKALELCWPKGVRLLCTFHVLQAFWRWLHDPKHKIKKEDQAFIMEKMKKILYERRQFWAHSFRVGLPICGNHTNNYIERSFGILKDIIFARTQAAAHKHPGHLRIAKHFLCPGWKGVDTNFINKTGVRNEFSVQSTRKDDLFYIVNSEIGTCTCPVGVSGAPCKHQGAVAMKYHIAILNFIPSLTPQDRMVYAYVTLEEVKADYQSDNPQLRTALDKFADRYHSAKSKSIPRLTSFLYDINCDLDPAAHVKSGSMICVQVESVKR
ncbi:hypothetical protein RclHR1_35340001 [Rhizophagus clarus]|uniref:SWIM-type domain-containing protein n=1 Tax=Rhizophagus clarus TaxID=94130 RepID=A0A2Z6S5U8_9GLOM|nr:hypothetical protein RclHR1_35340001 [Rhizophagus clarus]